MFGIHPVRRAGEAARELHPAHLGYGPLLQRDYWAVIDACRMSPSQLIAQVARHFEHFAPAEFALFQRGEQRDALALGDELVVHIAGAGRARVRLIHRGPQSFTLATVRGHPEAGRITFGAYRNRRGDVLFHIRSRARSSSRLKFYGFLGVGEPMQTQVWTDFVDRVAVITGNGVRGWIHAETTRCDDEEENAVSCTPTYLAEGD